MSPDIAIGRISPVYGAPLFENITKAFQSKIVDWVKVMAYAFRAETPIGKCRFPCGELTRGSLWTERKTG